MLEAGIQLFAQGLDLLIGYVGDSFQEFFNALAVVLGILAHRPRQGRTLGFQSLHLGLILGLFGLFLGVIFLLVHDFSSLVFGLLDQAAKLGIGRHGHAHCSHGDGGNQ